MTISPLVLAVRAVSAEFANRIYLPVVWGVGAALLILIGVSIWFVTISAWWWFLLAPLILVMLVFIFAAAVAGAIIQILKPGQTKAQRATVKQFVDTLQKTTETVATPKWLILARLVKDIAFPGKESYVSELSGSAASLQRGLTSVINSFRS